MSDRIARVLTGVAVLAVAVIAAIVSFSHIESLALAHGQPLTAARLLPLSVDGLLVVSSLTLLTEARARRSAPGMARAGLVLGVVATVLANLAYGARYGAVGAVISAWPALAFIVSTETLLTQMRRAGTTPAGEHETEAVATVPGDVAAGVPVNATVDAPASAVSPAPDVTAQAATDAVLPGVPGETPATPVSVPQDATDTIPPAVPVDVPRVAPAARVHRSQRRASSSRPKSPERVFASELAAGQVPSLRAIKAKMRCGTPRARIILAELQEMTQDQAA